MTSFLLCALLADIVAVTPHLARSWRQEIQPNYIFLPALLMESAAGIGASRADNLRLEKRKQQKREWNARAVLKRKAQAVTFAEREWGQHLGRLYEQMHDAAVPRDSAAERQWQQQLLMAQQRYLQIQHAQRQLQQQFQQPPPIATVCMHTPSSSSALSPSQHALPMSAPTLRIRRRVP